MEVAQEVEKVTAVEICIHSAKDRRQFPERGVPGIDPVIFRLFRSICQTDVF